MLWCVVRHTGDHLGHNIYRDTSSPPGAALTTLYRGATIFSVRATFIQLQQTKLSAACDWLTWDPIDELPGNRSFSRVCKRRGQWWVAVDRPPVAGSPMQLSARKQYFNIRPHRRTHSPALIALFMHGLFEGSQSQWKWNFWCAIWRRNYNYFTSPLPLSNWVSTFSKSAFWCNPWIIRGGIAIRSLLPQYL